ncbi:MAG: hypothetical protein ABH821_03190 [archaeon]
MDKLFNDPVKLSNLIAESTGKEQSEIEKLVNVKKEKFAGLLSEAGALFLVAKELGVDLGLSDNLSEAENLADLQKGMNNIALKVAVLNVFAPRKFVGKSKKGIMQSMMVGDASGEKRLTLWQENVKIIQEKKIRKGSFIDLRNAYVTEFNGSLELHLGYNSSINVLKEKLPEGFPVIEVKDTGFENLKENDLVDVTVRVERIFPTRSFVRDEEERTVSTFIANDGKQELKITAWSEFTYLVEKLREGMIVRLENVLAKKGLTELELHLNWQSHLLLDFFTDKKFESSIELPETIKTKVNKLIEGKFNCELNGIIVDVNKTNFFFKVCDECSQKLERMEEKFLCHVHGNRDNPENRMVGSLELDDGSGVIKTVLFDKEAQQVFGSNETVLKELERHMTEDLVIEKKKQLIGKQLTVVGGLKTRDREPEFVVRKVIELKEREKKEVEKEEEKREKKKDNDIEDKHTSPPDVSGESEFKSANKLVVEKNIIE